MRYCRVRGCRVYAELDTLVADSEMSAAADFVRSACEAGVDAVIVQDWGFLAAAKAVAPLLRAFAGERLGIHTAAGPAAAAQLGAARVIPPWELPREAIPTPPRPTRAASRATARAAVRSHCAGA